MFKKTHLRDASQQIGFCEGRHDHLLNLVLVQGVVNVFVLVVLDEHVFGGERRLVGGLEEGRR